ncbi:DUF6081 family protein [Streptomyces sp. NPDC048845]|uniref:DUF6081 family protein n=1 Tax=Streptomyces sp. NPDC048845 TaxID=3155390 RepID=UPI00341BB032
MKAPTLLVTAILTLGALVAPPVACEGRAHATAPASAPSVLWYDDFSGGFDHSGPGAPWLVPGFEGLPEGDGRATTSERGLRVVASGTHPRTGRPAFVHTVPQEDDSGTGVPGTADHGKWAALANHTASSGHLGFDAPAGTELTCATRMSGRSHGVQGHPFGDAVHRPGADPRLATAAMIMVDQETGTAFDFLVTDTAVHAYYERLPVPGNGAFAYAVPVAAGFPGQTRDLAISYDRSAGEVRWRVNGRTVLRVGGIGQRSLDSRFKFIDNGGPGQDVAPRQLACGLGLLTLLDGAGADGKALVRLSSAPDHYFDVRRGEPVPQRFVDDESLPGSRLWGQGAELRAEKLEVTSRPAG